LLEAAFGGQEAGVDRLSCCGLHEVTEDVESTRVAHFGLCWSWLGHWLSGGWSSCCLRNILLLNE
jgi:hypothetical protein